MRASVIIPSPEMREFERQLKPQYEIWKEQHEAVQPKFIIVNVKFRHDPEWDNRFWSITYIASGRSRFWNFIGLLFAMSASIGYGVSLGLAFKW